MPDNHLGSIPFRGTNFFRRCYGHIGTLSVGVKLVRTLSMEYMFSLCRRSAQLGTGATLGPIPKLTEISERKNC
jgi:hypothetical protein